ncbi:electron transfer flavoprotein subunit beta/FixA family protein [Acetobacteraceae bacterium ESL0709]|nr:electron transfer flavoprotein subunit beta/FixA family protein [Acetobacteraceae bacterium ESL0697]MDF7678829.1 electron transfer flavoprotein subunit beta/FixA family protein [Acetobacteraceae bacterium ESL0709]
MKILVPVKRVLDYNIKPRVAADGNGVDTQGAKMSMNPFDEIALEEAVRLREKGSASEVVAVSIGPQAAQDVLRTAMAMGADRAILVKTDQLLEPLAVAKILKIIIEREQPGLISMGKQAIDDDMNATGQMLAAMLSWPQATFASKVTVADNCAEVIREIDGGTEVISVPLPAVITADLRLNEPRYASLPNIMKARKKPLETIEADSLGVDLTPHLTILKVEEPSERKAGVIVKDIEELVSKLKTEAKVLP